MDDAQRSGWRDPRWLGLVLFLVAGLAACEAGRDAGRAVVGAGGSSPGAETCAAAWVAKAPLGRRVGQTLMVGAPVDEPTAVADVVSRYGLGGVFLAGRSTKPASAHRLAIDDLQRTARASTGVPVVVALDQEGGEVQTLRGPDFPEMPSAVEQGQWDPAVLRARTADQARALAAIGVTMDLAPVADTVPPGTAAENPPIGRLDREFGSDPGAVAGSVAIVASTLQAEGVLATLKHFPGLGRVRANTDTSPAAVDAVVTPTDPLLAP